MYSWEKIRKKKKKLNGGAYLLFLVRGILRDKLRDIFVDTPLVQELIKCILDTNIKGIELGKKI